MVEADFSRYYTMDLRDVCWGSGRIGVRRISALVGSLPRDSATVRALDPYGSGAGWSNSEELLASIIEVIDHGNRLLFAVHKQKSAKVPKPIKITRPGARIERKQLATPEETRAFFSKRRG